MSASQLWPDPGTAAVVRKYSPGLLAQVAAWIIAAVARLASGLVPVLTAPAVSCRPVLVPVRPAPAVAWSAPYGADAMRTGP